MELCEKHSAQMLDWIHGVLVPGINSAGHEIVIVPESHMKASLHSTVTIEQGQIQIEFWATQACHYANLLLGPEEALVRQRQRVDIERAKEEADELIRIFSEKFKEKYVNGQIEHGGRLMDMPTPQLMIHALEEVLDLWSYLMAVMHQMRR